MRNKRQEIIPAKQLEKNPAVDRRLVRKAEEVRKELEDLGVWEDKGSQVRSPHTPLPNSRTQDFLLEIRPT